MNSPEKHLEVCGFVEGARQSKTSLGWTDQVMLVGVQATVSMFTSEYMKYHTLELRRRVMFDHRSYMYNVVKLKPEKKNSYLNGIRTRAL